MSKHTWGKRYVIKEIYTQNLQPMSQDITMAPLNEETIFCTKIIMGCPLEIGGVTLEADLIVFNTLAFDIILGVDWLQSLCNYRLSFKGYILSIVENRS